MKNKSLDEIRPAKGGVKLKSKSNRENRKKREMKVIRDVPISQYEGDAPPTGEVTKALLKIDEAKKELFKAMQHLNKIVMKSKVLPENRSLEQERNEKLAVSRLVNAAINLDNLNPGEGTLGMTTIAVRQGILLRDAGNLLAYELSAVKNEINELKKELDDLKKRV
jgi:hypothetical protein